MSEHNWMSGQKPLNVYNPGKPSDNPDPNRWIKWQQQVRVRRVNQAILKADIADIVKYARMNIPPALQGQGYDVGVVNAGLQYDSSSGSVGIGVNPSLTRDAGFWYNPMRVARYYNAVSNLPPDMQYPTFLPPKETLEGMYNAYMELNENKPWWNWDKNFDENSAEATALKSLSAPPPETLLNEQEQFLAPMWQAIDVQNKQAQIGTWEKLHGWQKALLTAFSPQPTTADRPFWSRVVASTINAGMSGLMTGGAFMFTGLVPVAIGAGAVTFALALAQNLAGQEQNIPVVTDTLKVLNVPAQVTEQALGTAWMQMRGDLKDFDDWKYAWEASKNTYETLTQGLVNTVAGAAGHQAAKRNQVWRIESGMHDPVTLMPGEYFGIEALEEARNRIEEGVSSGRDIDEVSDEVYMDFVQRFGFGGTLNDFIYQTVFDPMNYAPLATSKILGSETGTKLLNRLGLRGLGEQFAKSAGNVFIDALPFPFQGIVEGIINSAPVTKFLGIETPIRGTVGVNFAVREWREAIRGGKIPAWYLVAPNDISDEVHRVMVNEKVGLGNFFYDDDGTLTYKSTDGTEKTFTSKTNPPTGKHDANMAEINKGSYKWLNSEGSLFDIIKDPARRKGFADAAKRKLIRDLSGLTPEGALKELQPVSVASRFGGFVQRILSLTPESKVLAALDAFMLHMGTIMAEVGGDREAFIKVLNKLRGIEPMDAYDMSKAVFASPIAVQVMKALRSAVTDSDITELMGVYDMVREKRAPVLKLANALYPDNPRAADLLIKNVLRDPQKVVDEIKSNPNIPEQIKQFSDVNSLKQGLAEFVSKENRLPISDAQMNQYIAVKLADKMEQFLVQHYNVKPDSWLTRFSKGAKSLSTLFLLNLNPSYFVNNWLNNMITRVVYNVWGIIPEAARVKLVDDFGIMPERYNVGIGDEALEKVWLNKAKYEPDLLSRFSKFTRDVNNRVKLFTYASNQMERAESQGATLIALQKYWGQVWQPENYGDIPEHLTQRFADFPELLDTVRTAVRNNMNMEDIRAKLLKPQRIDFESILDTVSRKINPDNPDMIKELFTRDATQKLRDELDIAVTDSDVDNAFANFGKEMDEHIRDRIAADYENKLGELRTASGLEKGSFLFEAIENMRILYTDIQVRQFSEWSNVLTELDNVSDPIARDAIYERTQKKHSLEWDTYHSKMIAHFTAILDGIDAPEASKQRITSSLKQLEASYETFWKEKTRLAREAKDAYSANKKKNAEIHDGYGEAVEKLYTEANTLEDQARAEIAKAFGELYMSYGGDGSLFETAMRTIDAIGLKRQQLVKEHYKWLRDHKNAQYAQKVAQNQKFWNSSDPETNMSLIAEMQQAVRENMDLLRRNVGNTPPASEPVHAPETPDEIHQTIDNDAWTSHLRRISDQIAENGKVSHQARITRDSIRAKLEQAFFSKRPTAEQKAKVDVEMRLIDAMSEVWARKYSNKGIYNHRAVTVTGDAGNGRVYINGDTKTPIKEIDISYPLGKRNLTSDDFFDKALGDIEMVSPETLSILVSHVGALESNMGVREGLLRIYRTMYGFKGDIIKIMNKKYGTSFKSLDDFNPEIVRETLNENIKKPIVGGNFDDSGITYGKNFTKKMVAFIDGKEKFVTVAHEMFHVLEPWLTPDEMKMCEAYVGKQSRAKFYDEGGAISSDAREVLAESYETYLLERFRFNEVRTPIPDKLIDVFEKATIFLKAYVKPSTATTGKKIHATITDAAGNRFSAQDIFDKLLFDKDSPYARSETLVPPEPPNPIDSPREATTVRVQPEAPEVERPTAPGAQYTRVKGGFAGSDGVVHKVVDETFDAYILDNDQMVLKRDTLKKVYSDEAKPVDVRDAREPKEAATPAEEELLAPTAYTRPEKELYIYDNWRPHTKKNENGKVVLVEGESGSVDTFPTAEDIAKWDDATIDAELTRLVRGKGGRAESRLEKPLLSGTGTPLPGEENNFYILVERKGKPIAGAETPETEAGHETSEQFFAPVAPIEQLKIGNFEVFITTHPDSGFAAYSADSGLMIHRGSSVAEVKKNLSGISPETMAEVVSFSRPSPRFAKSTTPLRSLVKVMSVDDIVAPQITKKGTNFQTAQPSGVGYNLDAERISKLGFNRKQTTLTQSADQKVVRISMEADPELVAKIANEPRDISGLTRTQKDFVASNFIEMAQLFSEGAKKIVLNIPEDGILEVKSTADLAKLIVQGDVSQPMKYGVEIPGEVFSLADAGKTPEQLERQTMLARAEALGRASEQVNVMGAYKFLQDTFGSDITIFRFLNRIPELEQLRMIAVGNMINDGYFMINGERIARVENPADIAITKDGNMFVGYGEAGSFVYIDIYGNVKEYLPGMTPQSIRSKRPSYPMSARKKGNPMGDVPPGTTPATFNDGDGLREVFDYSMEPVLKEMNDMAKSQLKTLRPAIDDPRITEDHLGAINEYLGTIQSEMSSAKLATSRMATMVRDLALLNYSRRYGADNILEWIFPYQFWFSRSMMNWMSRAWDKPSIMATYVRYQEEMDKMERAGIPLRFKDKARFNAAWLPNWMGGGLWNSPMAIVYPFDQLYGNIERIRLGFSSIYYDTNSVLDQMARDDPTKAKDVEKAKLEREGNELWDEAYKQAVEHSSSFVSNPVGLMSMMMAPAPWLQIPAYLASGTPERITPTPSMNLIQNTETALKGTVLEPAGNLLGWLAKPEQFVREKVFSMDEMTAKYGQWGDYYVDRELSNMVADGSIPTADEAIVAMLEREGNEYYEQAVMRVAQMVMLRTPGTSAIQWAKYLTQSGKFRLGDIPSVVWTSLVPNTILPTGELKQRGLYDGYKNAWKRQNQGVKGAIDKWLAEHPEYRARIPINKTPEEKLKWYLMNRIWAAYYELDKANRSAVVAQLGDEFFQVMENQKTTDPEAIDAVKLAAWAKFMGQLVPDNEQTEGYEQFMKENGLDKPAQLWSSDISSGVEKYTAERDKLFPGITQLQSGFYAITDKATRRKYLLTYPQLEKYWAWNRKYKSDHPELAPYFAAQNMNMENEPNMTLELVQTIAQYPGLLNILTAHYVNGIGITPGAMMTLQQIWEDYGEPGASFQDWIKNTVEPAFNN